MKTRTTLVAAALSLTVVGAPRADPIDDYLRQEMRARQIPGLGIAIARDGEIVRLSSYGLANIETATPVAEGSIFAIASLDKQITAAGVLKAAERGLLTLDDPLSKWVEVDFPGVTLRHLLAHTSGLPDSVAETVSGRSFSDYSTEQLLAHVAGLTPVAPPGHHFLYSDAGLFLAQLATQKAAGTDWWSFMRRELFGPLGMTSAVSMRPAAILAQRVAAYTLEGPAASSRLIRDRRLDFDYDALYSDLGMTVSDFARFLAAQDRLEPGRGLSSSSLVQLTSEVRLGGGIRAGEATGELFQWSRYGLGVGLDEILGEPVTLHSGHSGVGFVRFPKRRLAVVVFTNLEHPVGSDPVGLAIGIAGLLEPSLSLRALPVAAEGSPSASELQADFDALIGSRPFQMERFAPGFQAAAWEGGTGLAGRIARLGKRTGFEVIGREILDGRRAALCRVSYAQGQIVLRLSYDADGRISRAVWWHL